MIVFRLMARRARGLIGSVAGAPPANLRWYG